MHICLRTSCFCIKIIHQDYSCFSLRAPRVIFLREMGYLYWGFSWFYPEPLGKCLEYLQLGDDHFLLLPSTSLDASNLEVLKTTLNTLTLSFSAAFSLFFFSYILSNFGSSFLNVLFNDAVSYWDYLASVTLGWSSMGCWCNDTGTDSTGGWSSVGCWCNDTGTDSTGGWSSVGRWCNDTDIQHRHSK